MGFSFSSRRRFAIRFFRSVKISAYGDLYSAYKTESDPETREMLRISYLDKAGIPSHGRWEEETERKYMKGEFYD
jgi:hypothetical protein